MTDKERTVTDRIREAVNSPTGQRVISTARDFVRDPLNISEAARAIRSRKKGKQGRATTGRR